MGVVKAGPPHQRLSQPGPRREPAEHTSRLLDFRGREPQLLDRLPTALPCGLDVGRLTGEQTADQPAAGSTHAWPERDDRFHHVEKRREWSSVPAFHDLAGEDALPGRAACPQPRADRPRENPLEPRPFARHAGGELRHGAAQWGQGFLRLPQKPAGEVEAAGAANATGGPPHQLRVDRLHQFTKASVGLEARGRARRRLDPIEPEDPRHDEALRLQLPPPVVPNVGIPRGVGLHEQQRPARSEGGHLAGDDPRAVFLRR